MYHKKALSLFGRTRSFIFGSTVALTASALTAIAAPEAASPLPAEPLGVIQKLPSRYPAEWFLVHDSAFFHMSDGKVYVLDPTAENLWEQVKGTFNISLMGNYRQSFTRSEIYATEAFHTRGTRGERIDVLTIWDTATLSPSAEVVLPAGKRFMGMPERYALLLMNDENWLAIANFSPATSVTLVDLNKREIVGEVATPGCSFTYPLAKRSFFSLCADGRLMSTRLGPDGAVLEQRRSEPFFSSDDTPIFERPAKVGDALYFPSFDGRMFPVGTEGSFAVPREPWDLAVNASEKQEAWAPGGIAIIDHDSHGNIYVLMHPGAAEGTHNGGGSEIWVFNAATQKRSKRIKLQEWGLSIAVSKGDIPLVLVTNPLDMSMELYRGDDGSFIRKVTGFGQETPLMANGAAVGAQ